MSTTGDTIVTGDSTFALMILAMDDGGIDSVSFNGRAADDVEQTATGEIHTKIITGLALTRYAPGTVRAE